MDGVTIYAVAPTREAYELALRLAPYVQRMARVRIVLVEWKE